MEGRDVIPKMAEVEESKFSSIKYPPKWPTSNMTCTQCEQLLRAATHSSPSSSGWVRLSAVRQSATDGCRCCQIVSFGVSKTCPSTKTAPETVCFGRKIVAESYEWL